MIIEDKLTEFIEKNKRVNNYIIYEVDMEVHVTKVFKAKTNKSKQKRIVIIKNKLWQKNPGKAGEKYENSLLEKECDIKENETFEIKKVTLKREISCSFYER